jgi:uncharacterized protein (DUF433 family)
MPVFPASTPPSRPHERVRTALFSLVKTSDILHGKPRIEGTRIGVFHIGELVHQYDWSLEDVFQEFDLDIGTVEAALDYYDEHPELVETLRAQHESGSRRIKRQSRAAE